VKTERIPKDASAISRGLAPPDALLQAKTRISVLDTGSSSDDEMRALMPHKKREKYLDTVLSSSCSQRIKWTPPMGTQDPTSTIQAKIASRNSSQYGIFMSSSRSAPANEPRFRLPDPGVSEGRQGVMEVER
jgi:hypothetical protein